MVLGDNPQAAVATPQSKQGVERPRHGSSRVFRRSRGPAAWSSGSRSIPFMVGGSGLPATSTEVPSIRAGLPGAPVASDGEGSSATGGVRLPDAPVAEGSCLPTVRMPEVAVEDPCLPAALAAGGSRLPAAAAVKEPGLSTTATDGGPSQLGANWPLQLVEGATPPSPGPVDRGPLLPEGPTLGGRGRPERTRRRPAWCQDYVISP